MENNLNKTSAIEAVLFIHGDPIETKKLAKILNAGEDEIKIHLGALAENFKNEERGLSLVFHDEKVQLVAKPEHSPIIESLVKNEFDEALTSAALETLSLIAYLGPISRSKIDYLRGVNSSYTVRNLMMRGLVERSSDPNKANVFLYRISFDLLKYLGINSINDLPECQKYRNLILES